MNGKDGKPFKTREGGVMRLEYLVSGVNDEMFKKIEENQKSKEELDFDVEEAKATAKKIALAAIKYGDLSNQASKDYIFDIDRFASFEGNTGPYILYTIVRIKSLMNKVASQGITVAEDTKILPAANKSQTDLMLALTKWSETVESAFAEQAPHKICQFVYELSDAFNKFYHENKIVTNEDETARAAYIKLSQLVGGILETAIDLLGLEAPEQM